MLGGSGTAIQFSHEGLLKNKANDINDTGIAICEALTVCDFCDSMADLFYIISLFVNVGLLSSANHE